MAEWRGVQSRAIEKALDPIFDREIELDSSKIDEQRDFPNRDGA